MSNNLQDNNKLYDEAMMWLEKELSLPPHFIYQISNENDWSFIIKTHALIEAALTDQLSKSIDSRLTSVFEQLELSDSRKGKIAFSKALDLLDSKQHKFVRQLSELRNILVHDVRKISFELKSFLANLDNNQRASFIGAITYFTPDSSEGDSWRSLAANDPKLTISAATFFILLQIISKGQLEKTKKDLINEKARMMDEAFSDNKVK